MEDVEGREQAHNALVILYVPNANVSMQCNAQSCGDNVIETGWGRFGEATLERGFWLEPCLVFPVD